MLTQVYSDGFSVTMLNSIVNYQKYESLTVPKSDMYVVTRQGQKSARKTTVWWSLLVKWDDD